MRFQHTTSSRTKIQAPLLFSQGEYIFLCIIVISAFLLRFVELETPSMWWDEILVPMTARYPLTYIFDWAKTLEVNSPYYILLVKLNMFLGKSDFCLRIISAVSGVFAVLVIANVGRIIANNETGIFSALILSAWPLHVLLSRQLRPYAIFSLILILSIWRVYIFAISNKNTLKNCVALGATYTALFCLHYMAAPVIVSHAAFVIIRSLSQEKRFYKIFLFGITSIVSFLPVAPFFVGTFLQRKDMLGAADSYGEVLSKTLSAIYHISNSFIFSLPLDYILPATVGSILLGSLFLLIISFCTFKAFGFNREWGLLVCCSIFVPLIFFIVTKQLIWRPRHLSFLLPPFALALGSMLASTICAVENKKVLKGVYVALLVLPTVSLVWLHKEQLYYKESYPDVYKSQARQLAGLLPHGELSLVAQFGDFNALSWYLTQFMENNPLDFQNFHNKNQVVLNLITPGNTFGQGNFYQKEFLENMGPPSHSTSISKATIHRYEWNRLPSVVATPSEITSFSAKPWSFYRAVTELENVTVEWPNDPFVRPTLNESLCWFKKVFTFDSARANSMIDGEFRVFSKGVDNKISSEITIDGKAVYAIINAGGDSGEIVQRFKIIVPQVLSSLSATTKMFCGVKTPSYPGSNLDTVGFKEFKFRVQPLNELKFGSKSLLESFTGLDPVEESPKGIFRWAHGPETLCSFSADSEKNITLEFEFSNIIQGQDVEVFFNDKPIKSYSGLLASKWLESALKERIELRTMRGQNVVKFKFKKFNGLDSSSTFAPSDTRTLSVPFLKFLIENEDQTIKEKLILE